MSPLISPTDSQGRPASLLSKYKRKKATMLAELSEDIHELDLRLKVAQSNRKFAEHVENKARNELQRLQLVEQDVPSERQIDANIRDRLLLQTALKEFTEKHRVLIEGRHPQGSNENKNADDSQLSEEPLEDHQSGSVAFHMEKAAAKIVEEVRQLEEDKLAIKKMKQAAADAVKAAVEELSRRRDEARAMADLAEALEEEYNDAVAEKTSLEV
ncbi:uncharacterized protein CTRU02_215272 [Colletotrichum truncatum]|uniref:Uncharacterized protein n=1 Tax=Colletotrichum truncatum TaxID=5467 RepID=A0ACC3YDC0_COLTU